MRIVNITVNATEATYPQRIVIDVVWDQAFVSYEVKNLIFETEQKPGITITGYDPVDGTSPTPTRVFLGQTLIQQKDIKVLNPYTIQFSFTVSPFMVGILRVSNQSWNKPLVLKVVNAAGVEGDWSPFLAPNVFSNVKCFTYYPYVQSDTTSISPTPTRGLPTLRSNWACGGPGSVTYNYPGTDIKISNTSDFTPRPIVPWDGGNFWWWTAGGASYFNNPFIFPFFQKYYSTNDTRTCSGPRAYNFAGLGGQDITTTQLPTYLVPTNYETAVNSYGSRLASNTFGGTAAQDHAYNPCPYYGPDPQATGAGLNSAIGRFEGWILANPANGDPLKNMPSTWTNQRPSSANLNCLAPWRLAKDTDPVPMLIQVYFQLNWIYTTTPIP
jgi:hypothetical protein